MREKITLVKSFITEMKSSYKDPLQQIPTYGKHVWVYQDNKLERRHRSAGAVIRMRELMGLVMRAKRMGCGGYDRRC